METDATIDNELYHSSFTLCLSLSILFLFWLFDSIFFLLINSGSGDEVNEIDGSSKTKRALFKPQKNTAQKELGVHIRGAKTIYTAGRPPWYDSSGQMMEPLIIGSFWIFF